jgi:hypothetical protein|tara:strand:- start:176 stop:445 length:270 start_codon:yes stop_codon:yes gene_type:complete
MKDYVPLLKVGNGKVNTKRLLPIDLKERSLNKLDAKIYFTKLKLNDIVNEINNWQNKTETQKDHLVIRYEATDSELQVLEYMYKQTKGI